MKREIRDRWTAALRSGEYEQGEGVLRTKDGKYCCLGVLCDVVGFDLDAHPEQTWLSRWGAASGVATAPPVLEALVEEGYRQALADRNDDGLPFTEIADWIDVNIPVE